MYWQFYDFVRTLATNIRYLDNYEKRTFGSSVHRVSDLVNIFLKACVFVLFMFFCFYFFTHLLNNQTSFLFYVLMGIIIAASLLCFFFMARSYFRTLHLFIILGVICFILGVAFTSYTLSKYQIIKRGEDVKKCKNVIIENNYGKNGLIQPVVADQSKDENQDGNQDENQKRLFFNQDRLSRYMDNFERKVLGL